MNSDINLVLEKNQKDLLLKKRAKIFRNTAVISLSVISFLSVVLFILASTSSLSSIKKSESSVLQNIAFLHKKSIKLYFLNDRVNNISKILIKRKDYTKAVDAVLSQIPDTATPTIFQIDKDGMTLKITSKSLVPINKFMDGFIELSQTKKIIKDLIISALTLDKQTETYSLLVKAKII